MKNYIPTVLNTCIEEFDISSNPINVRRSLTGENLQQGNYGTIDQVSQPIVVDIEDKNDLMADKN